MPTVDCPALAGDGQLTNNGSIYLYTWAQIVAGTHGTLGADPTSTGSNVYADYNAFSDFLFYCYRTFLPFDTSAVPTDAASIDTAVVRVYPSFVASGGGGSVSVVASTQASSTTLTTSDWTTIGATAFATQNFSAFSTGAYNDLTLDANGRAAVVKGGTTNLALRGSHDLASVAPSAGTYSQVAIHTSEHATAAFRPVLQVTYTAAAAGGPPPRRDRALLPFYSFPD